MNSQIIDRLQEQYDSSKKSYKGKSISGAKERATKRYFKDAAARSRRKQGKTRFNTHRRNEEPDAEDLRLEDIHYANFLGLKDSKYGVPYNNCYSVNLSQCDTLSQCHISPNVHDNIECYDDLDHLIDHLIEINEIDYNDYYNCCVDDRVYRVYVGQIEFEHTNCETAHPVSIKNVIYFKHRHDEEEEEDHEKPAARMRFDYCVEDPEQQPPAKRMRFDSCVEDHEQPPAKRMRFDSCEMTRMEESFFYETQQQVSIDAMTDYMRQQVALAQQMITDNDVLYSCDCKCLRDVK